MLNACIHIGTRNDAVPRSFASPQMNAYQNEEDSSLSSGRIAAWSLPQGREETWYFVAFVPQCRAC